MTFLLLLGCATVPRSQPKYVEYASIPEKAAIVNIYSLLGAAFPMRVYEDNTFIVELKYVSYYTFYLPPGSYQLIAEKWNMHKKYTSWS